MGISYLFFFFQKEQVQSKAESERQKSGNASSCFSAGMTHGTPPATVNEGTTDEDGPQCSGCSHAKNPEIVTASKHLQR